MKHRYYLRVTDTACDWATMGVDRKTPGNEIAAEEAVLIRQGYRRVSFWRYLRVAIHKPKTDPG